MKRPKDASKAYSRVRLPGPLNVPRKAFASRDKAKPRLEALAGSLRAHDFLWPATAIQGYLDGKFKTLDEAFGLTTKGQRGRKLEPHNDALARRVFAMRLNQKHPPSFEAIAEELGVGERELRRLYDKRHLELLAEEMDRRLEAGWQRTDRRRASKSGGRK